LFGKKEHPLLQFAVNLGIELRQLRQFHVALEIGLVVLERIRILFGKKEHPLLQFAINLGIELRQLRQFHAALEQFCSEYEKAPDRREPSLTCGYLAQEVGCELAFDRGHGDSSMLSAGSRLSALLLGRWRLAGSSGVPSQVIT
jgi:hypothetical protein